MRLLKALLIWLVLCVVAFVNGGLREALLLPLLGKPVAFLLSGALLSLCIVAVAALWVPRLGLLGTGQSLGVGLLWLLLTLAFEFGFGRFVQGKSWSQLLEAYTFRDGNIWPVVLAVTFLAPLVAVRFHQRATPASVHGA